MDEHTDSGRAPTEGDQREPLGTLGQEAVKLLAEASAWARDRQTHAPPRGEGPDEPCPSCGSTAPGVAHSWCPICQAATFVRSTDPELSAAVRRTAVSLGDLARTVLDSLAEHQHQHQHQHQRHRAHEEGDDAWG